MLAGDLLDTSDVRSNDIVAGGVLHMDVWNTWKQLVEAAAKNDIDWVGYIHVYNVHVHVHYIFHGNFQFILI